MPEEEIRETEEVAALPREKEPEEPREEEPFREDREALDEFFNRRLHPINVPLVRRSVKLRDAFTLSGAVETSATVVEVSTDTNGTTETTLQSFRFLPGELYPGLLVRVTATGTYTSDATRTVTVRVGSGTAPTTEWNSMTSTAAAATDTPWNLVWYGLVATIGSSGTLEAQLSGAMNNVKKDDANTATVTVNTQAALTVGLTAQWSANVAGNSIKLRQWLVEVLN